MCLAALTCGSPACTPLRLLCRRFCCVFPLRPRVSPPKDAHQPHSSLVVVKSILSCSRTRDGKAWLSGTHRRLFTHLAILSARLQSPGQNLSTPSKRNASSPQTYPGHPSRPRTANGKRPRTSTRQFGPRNFRRDPLNSVICKIRVVDHRTTAHYRIRSSFDW